MTDKAGDPFFRRMALAMIAIIVAGFVVQLLAGRSTFAMRPLVHVHALAFFGWLALFAVQLFHVRAGRMARHSRLGWFGAFWVALMVVLGIVLTVDVTRLGIGPFFFTPQQFLVLNPLGIIGFAGLTAAAILLRRRSDWHKRLHIGALALLMGPAFSRLMPMPLIVNWAFSLTTLAGLAFPAWGAVRDWRVTGRVHPAWLWGLGTGLLWLASTGPVAHSKFGDALYLAVTQNSPGANIPGRVLPPVSQ